MIVLLVLLFALAGAPVFAVMAGGTQLAWLTHEDPNLHFVRFLAPDVLGEIFAQSPILTTIPLFTFVGYILAESKAPERIVRASDAFFGWLPGGLPIVCLIASAFFTTLTGGSAVTIVAVGALLYPALIRHGYPKDYALGLVMTSGSVGLLLPPSLPILIYSLVAGIDFNMAFKAGVLPGLLVIVIISLHAAYISVRHKIPRTSPRLSEMRGAFWIIKWELGIPVLILGSLATGLADIDESAGIAAAYVIAVEFMVHKDLKFKDLPRLAGNAMALAGALILILAAAISLTNYIVSEQLPQKVYQALTDMGVSKRWHFLLVLNAFLYLQGMVMDGFSTILVTVPLLIPFAAQFVIHPFHMCIMFLLNMEIGYLSPPLGQNLFVTSFRFNRPMVHLYRICIPFLGMMILSLVIVVLFPRLSTAAVEKDIREAKEKAAKFGEPPREAWLLECVQEDRNNPLPCTEEDRKKWLSADGRDIKGADEVDDGHEKTATEKTDDELFQDLMGTGEDEVKLDSGAQSGDAGATDEDDELKLEE
ncbi:MAG TPA: TRAP transporter large permease [Polyangiaceae bacterium]